MAYELLFRSGMENRFDGNDGESATKTVISNAFLTIGSNRILGAKRGFINFTRALLLDRTALMLPKDRVVIEILEDVEPDADVVESCRQLKAAGYRIALDDISTTPAFAPLLKYATYAKLDWLAIGIDDRRPLCEFFHKKGLRLLAEKVETKADFDSALSNGCELFQGYYFARPEIVSAGQVPPSKMASLRLISETQKPELEFTSLEAIVKLDVGLTQRLLIFANSALFTHRQHIESLKQALLYVGEDNLRRWISLVALQKIASGKPAELLTLALTRARLCEMVADNSSLRRRKASCFLMGLVSMLDAMLGRPIEELIRELGVEAHLADAILGMPQSDGRFGSVLPLAVALERSDFEVADRHASAIGIPPPLVSELYVEAMQWADRVPR